MDAADPDEARRHLEHWHVLSQFVENEYLHQRADALERQLSKRDFSESFLFEIPPRPDPDNPGKTLTLKSYVQRFERWLLQFDSGQRARAVL